MSCRSLSSVLVKFGRAMSVLGALVRSRLHLALLSENAPNVRFVLYRDAHIRDEIEHLFPGRGVFLGREFRPSLNPWVWVRNFIANSEYYSRVRDVSVFLEMDELIIFLEGEPLERMICDFFDRPVQLWEEGMSHYVDLTNPIWYALRGILQIINGYYPRGALSRRADRGRFKVFDRFEESNLRLEGPRLAQPLQQLLFVGSPLVTDGIVSKKNYRAGLREIASVSPFPVRYLPHPREEVAGVNRLIGDIDNMSLAEGPHSIFAHTVRHGYTFFLSPASTALLDIGAPDRCLFVPKLFKLSRMHRVLSCWRANPIRVLPDASALKALLSVH